MKIGIITYWDSQDNYGQLLQCFALQAYLAQQGYTPFLIRYKSNPRKKIEWKKLSPMHLFRYVRFRLKSHGNSDTQSGVTRDFTSFREHIPYSEKVYHGFNELAAENWGGVDAFICGSDQIWSPKDNDDLKAYFLQFAPFQSQHISYAPSFGRESLDDYYQKILPALLSGFDAVSCREYSGVKIIEKAGVYAQLVCDPTLILDEAIYKKEFGLFNEKTRNTIFCYFIHWDTDWCEEDVIAFCKKNNLTPELFSTLDFKTSLQLHATQSPEEWLKSVASSCYTIVNSFHGLVFSLIFHKPFAVYLLKGKDAVMNGRVLSLLDFLGLEDRIVSKDNSLDSVLSSDIDWQDVDMRLKSFRQKSELYLSEALAKKNTTTSSHRICFLTYGGVHHKYGGLDRVTEILADGFERDGHKVYYLSFNNRGEYDKKRQYFFPNKDNIHSEINNRFFSEFIKEHNVDIVINQEGNVNLCLPLENRDSIVKITCLHFNPNYIDDKHFQYKFSKSGRLTKGIANSIFSIPPVNRLALRHLRNKLGRNYIANLEWCDKFILLSHRFNTPLISLAGDKIHAEKLESIFNPNPQASATCEHDEKTKTILYVGRLDNNFKRIDQLMHDVGMLLSGHPDWRFVLCGDGPDREYLTQLATSISDRIEFAGFCDPTPYYKVASVIVLRSSKSEGWGMVLVEAMSHGVVPVCAATYESLPDIIDSGINGFITTDSSRNFLNHLESLIKQPELLEDMSNNARRKASTFAPEKILSNWYKLFDKCCSR